MKDHYDLKNPRKNPYAERMKNGYRIIIEHEQDEDEKAVIPILENANKNKLAEFRKIIENY